MPVTAAQVVPPSVDLTAENVGAGVTSVVAGEEHFHPIVPPALPVSTTWYVAPGVRVRGDPNVNVSFSCPHAPSERFEVAVASKDPGLFELSARISMLYELVTADELFSFALRSMADTDVNVDAPDGAVNDCASQVAPCAVRHGPSADAETNVNGAADT